MKSKKECCEKYRKKATACKGCPLFGHLGKKELRRLLKKARKQGKLDLRAAFSA